MVQLHKNLAREDKTISSILQETTESANMAMALKYFLPERSEMTNRSCGQQFPH